jgi:two-component system copper resistance phosphate regulon response regulator CusR
MKVLIVEDEIKVAAFIKKGLEDYGMQADIALDGTTAERMFTSSVYNIIILDVNLPHISGFELCKRIRSKNIHTPILMLTALGTTDDKLTGFDAGADDYLVKPFEFMELLARLRSLNKRSQMNPEAREVLRVADLELNLIDKTVRRNNKKISLTARELSLLEFFMKNKGRALTRISIAEKVWDINFDTGTNVIDVYVNSLRKKIDKDFSPKLIHTLTGIGYIMKEEEL